MPLMTVSAYAKTRGVARNAVAYQIGRGVILRRPDGLIDTDQADQAWIPEKNGTASNPEAERRKRQADLTTQLVKFNLTRVQLDRMQGKYVEKSPASEAILERIDIALAHLHAAPAKYASVLAELLGIEKDRAQTIPQRAITTALDELCDVRADAARAIERL